MIFLLFSCELTYEPNRRLLIKGQVENQENIDFPTLPVDVYASGRFFSPLILFPFGYSNTEDIDRIGNGELNADGSYNITTISPSNAYNIFLVVNGEDAMGYQTQWPTLVIQRLNVEPLETHTYEVPVENINPIVETQLRVSRTNNQTDTLLLTLNFNGSVKELSLDPELELEAPYQGLLGIQLNPTETDGSLNFENIGREPVQVHYQLLNNIVVEEMEVLLPYNPETNTYEFDF